MSMNRGLAVGLAMAVVAFAGPALAQSKYVPLPPRGEVETTPPSAYDSNRPAPRRDDSVTRRGGDDQAGLEGPYDGQVQARGDEDDNPNWAPASRSDRPFPPADRQDDGNGDDD